MTIRQSMWEVVQDDARRAGDRDRMLLEARRARMAGRRHAAPGTWVSRLTRTLFRRDAARPGFLRDRTWFSIENPARYAPHD
jgi:hypothetical protein